MNGIIWNVRGLDASGPRIFQLIKYWRVNFVIVIEPMVDFYKAGFFKLELGLSNVLFSPLNKIWIFWDSNVIAISEVTWESQYTHFKVTNGSFEGWITAIYAKHTHVERRLLWDHLKHYSTSIIVPWMMGGYFNAIVDHSKHKGACIPNLISMMEF
ncbi:unnamed protein product [Cuscuta europaea]|uniref:Uncharacterized protein n=1 Tax=Cuscuta europaea TaxID=41803 RepID=A0A9P1E5M7_CUSEU|nr:unnamed protein product [Cuscuta europaea]